MLLIPNDLYTEMLAGCIRGLPREACGLLAGNPDEGEVERIYAAKNRAKSAKRYEVDSKDMLKADKDAEKRGMEILGVYHSHTETDAWPSPTDVAEAPDPGWHYVVVSLRQSTPVVRSFSIVDGEIEEESVIVMMAERLAG